MVRRAPGIPMRSTCPPNNRSGDEVAEKTANLMLDDPPLTVRINGAFSTALSGGVFAVCLLPCVISFFNHSH